MLFLSAYWLSGQGARAVLTFDWSIPRKGGKALFWRSRRLARFPVASSSGRRSGRGKGGGGAEQWPVASLTAEVLAAVTRVAEPLEAPPGAGKSWKRRQVSAGSGERGGACGPRRPRPGAWVPQSGPRGPCVPHVVPIWALSRLGSFPPFAVPPAVLVEASSLFLFFYFLFFFLCYCWPPLVLQKPTRFDV